ncbi:hypothetical protein ACEWPJ_16740 [Aliiroseovarius sp. YM-037]
MIQRRNAPGHDPICFDIRGDRWRGGGEIGIPLEGNQLVAE